MRHRSRRGESVERRFRFDPPPAVLETEETVRNRLLDRFREWIRSAPKERRRSARHETEGFQVWLGWWQGRQEFFAVSAELENMSRGGALVRLVSPPPELEDVWVCLDARRAEDCVPATAYDVSPLRGGQWSARLAFRAPCPHSFFEAAVRALEARRPGR